MLVCLYVRTLVGLRVVRCGGAVVRCGCTVIVAIPTTSAVSLYAEEALCIRRNPANGISFTRCARWTIRPDAPVTLPIFGTFGSTLSDIEILALH